MMTLSQKSIEGNGAGNTGLSANGSTGNGARDEAQYAHIVGWGHYAPPNAVSNGDLAQTIDTSDEWIRSRTGIAQRHIITDSTEATASQAVTAAQRALDVAGVAPDAVDMIICATCTADYQIPSTASIVQHALGATQAGAFDLNAACSGFVYGLSLARSHIVAGAAKHVLVIGAETISRFLDWSDRSTCVLFGDGAGAVLVTARTEPGGIGPTVLGSDGSGAEALRVPAGGSAIPASRETVDNGDHYLQMDGFAVFRFATRIMVEATREALSQSRLTVDDIDLLIPHQANKRIIHHTARKKLKLPDEKVFVNLHKYGNTSAASIPIALCEAIEAGRVSPGHNLVLVGFGAGLTWGACAIRWQSVCHDREASANGNRTAEMVVAR